MDGKFVYNQRSIDPQQIAKLVGTGAVLLLVLIILGTSFYTVDTDSQGVVQRFGKYVRIESPGLHFKWPAPIEQVEKVAVLRNFKEEFGFRTVSAGVETRYQEKKFLDESLMLCGDLSVAEVEWIVQYKIDEPEKYLFNIRNPEQIIRDVAQAIMRNVVGDSSVDEVLTVRRMEIGDEARVKMQAILTSYDSGIRIETVKLQDVNPPEKVKPAFNDVNAAQQDRVTKINQAMEQMNDVIPKARGEALQMVKQAQAYAIDRTNTAEGDAARFNQVYEQYKINKDVTRRRLYLEAMGEVLPALEKKYIIDKDVKGVLPLMQIGENK